LSPDVPIGHCGTHPGDHTSFTFDANRHFLDPSDEAEQTVEESDGMGRASGDEEVHREQVGAAVLHLLMVVKGPSGDGTGAGGDDDLRVGYGIVGIAQGRSYVLCDGAGDQEPVGMTGGGDELNPESSQVVGDGAQDIDIGFTGAAPAGADLPQAQGTSEEFSDFLSKSFCNGVMSVRDNQVLPIPDGHPVILGEV